LQTVDKIIVFSTEKSKGALSIGKQQTYTKTFDIALSNNSQQANRTINFMLKSLRFEWKRI